ncbi:hypothetical protein BH20CHL1_BH20CHL1_05800 [soil metagenome]
MEIRATIEGLRPFLIHSERYTQLYYSQTDDPDTIHQARLGSADLPEGLRVGEKVIIFSLMGIVAEVRRVEDESSA